MHTGNVTGGIIGTVRFHFDMWGEAVAGAVAMEEGGAKGSLHISAATARLLPQDLAPPRALSDQHVAADALQPPLGGVDDALPPESIAHQGGAYGL